MTLDNIYNAVLNGRAPAASEQTRAALEAGHTADEILNKACMPAMAEVGRQFEEGEKFVPEMLIAARAMQAAVEILRPLLVEAGIKTVGKVVIGTVQGDLHDIGKNLVGMMLEGAGFEIIDMGTDVSPEKFVEAVRAADAKLLGMSSLLTTTMPAMKTTIEALTKAGLRDQVKVIVGGAPVTAGFAKDIGADAYAPDAASAVDTARDLVA